MTFRSYGATAKNEGVPLDRKEENSSGSKYTMELDDPRIILGRIEQINTDIAEKLTKLSEIIAEERQSLNKEVAESKTSLGKLKRTANHATLSLVLWVLYAVLAEVNKRVLQPYFGEIGDNKPIQATVAGEALMLTSEQLLTPVTAVFVFFWLVHTVMDWRTTPDHLANRENKIHKSELKMEIEQLKLRRDELWHKYNEKKALKGNTKAIAKKLGVPGETLRPTADSGTGHDASDEELPPPSDLQKPLLGNTQSDEPGQTRRPNGYHRSSS